MDKSRNVCRPKKDLINVSFPYMRSGTIQNLKNLVDQSNFFVTTQLDVSLSRII